MRCKGFLFDLDGTLVNSLPVVERSWCRWADRHGLSHADVLNFIHGKQAITSLRHFLPDADDALLQAEFSWLEKIEAEDIDGITALPGALALLNRLDEQQPPGLSLLPVRCRSPTPATRRRGCRSRQSSSRRSRWRAVSPSRMPIC